MQSTNKQKQSAFTLCKTLVRKFRFWHSFVKCLEFSRTSRKVSFRQRYRNWNITKLRGVLAETKESMYDLWSSVLRWEWKMDTPAILWKRWIWWIPNNFKHDKWLYFLLFISVGFTFVIVLWANRHAKKHKFQKSRSMTFKNQDQWRQSQMWAPSNMYVRSHK